MDGLERRFKECITEKNGTLIRDDILQSMRNVYDAVKDEKVKEKALELIGMEEDPKYRKKYASLWRKGKKVLLPHTSTGRTVPGEKKEFFSKSSADSMAKPVFGEQS